MFYFSTANQLYKHFGLLLLVLQLGLYVLGMPPLQVGIWVQTEAILLAVYVFAALTALWLAIGLTSGWLAMEKNSWLWKLMVAWVLWQLFATALATSPWLSWFGHPQMGEGAGWYVASLLMFMLACPLWRVASYKRILLYAVIINIAIMCLLHWFNQKPEGGFYPDSWAPMQWPAYLGFLAAYLWIAVSAGRPLGKGGWYALLIIATFVILYTSLNRSAIALVSAAMVISTLVIACRQRNFLQRVLFPSRVWRGLAILACFLPFSALLLVPELSIFNNKDQSSVLWVFSDRSAGMGSRLMLNQMAVSTMAHEPDRWIAGDGWGRFNHDHFKYVLVEGVYAYKNGVRAPNSFLVNGHSFHSHSQPLETLLSLGLPGMLLWFAIPACLIWGVPRRYFWQCAPMIAAVVMLSHFWFLILQCLPYQAICYAALANLRSGRKQLPVPEKTLPIAAVLLVASLVMTWSSWQQSAAIVYDTQIIGAARGKSYPDHLGDWMNEDIKRGGGRFMTSAFFYVPWLGQRDAAGKVTANDIAWFTHFRDTAGALARAETTGAEAVYLDLWVHYNMLVALSNPLFAEMQREATQGLEGAVMRVVEHAPLRYDIIAPFLQQLAGYTQGEVSRQVEILNKILAVSPDHPGALWAMGHVLLNMPGREQEGRNFIDKAVSLGVEKYYPVTNDQLAKYR